MLLSLGALLALAAPPSGLAQTARPAPDAGSDSTQVQRFRLADAYFRAGQFDRAITLLEDLYAAEPQTYAFYEKLKQAYENVKRYDDAIRLVEARMAGTSNPVLLAEKASLLYLKGDEEAASRTWDEALATGPESAGVYRAVYQSMVQQRLFGEAADVLQRGREALDDERLFGRDLAYLYSLTGEHERAMEEYLALLDEDERQLSFVQNRLARFTEGGGDVLEESVRATERAVRRRPLNRAYRELLAWLHLEGEDYRAAYDVYRAVDRLEKEEGRVLFGFAQLAADADAYAVALDAYDEILRRYPDSPAAPEALYGLAKMHERWGEGAGETALSPAGDRVPAPHYEQALATYRQFLQTYPTHPYYPDVLRSIGRLQLDVFLQLGQAESTLREVVSRYARSPAAERAAYDLGRIALLRGDLDAARLAFSRLEEELRLGELAEQARYELALLHFYRGEFEAALSLARALNENTSTDIANDAIELKVLIAENRGPDSLSAPLGRYARARLLLRQQRPQAALDTLDVLLDQSGAHALADDVRFLRADALRRSRQTEAALAAFQEFPLIHPQSYLADQTLFLAAEIQEEELNDADAAITTYTQLLTDYPGSLFAQEARARIRRLRGDTL